MTIFLNLLLRPCTLSFLKISLNQWRLAYRNWKLNLVFASLSKSLTASIKYTLWRHIMLQQKEVDSISKEIGDWETFIVNVKNGALPLSFICSKCWTFWWFWTYFSNLNSLSGATQIHQNRIYIWNDRIWNVNFF